jgi:hypothetical protein
MHDTAEGIRREMDETKQQLVEKVGALEHQVSATVQSVGETVNSTVGAVRDVVQSVGNTFDIPRQVERHPWWALGGALALGYVAARMLEGETEAPSRVTLPSRSANLEAANPLFDGADAERTRPQPADTDATVAAVAAAYETCMKNSAGNELRAVAFNALLGAVSQVVAKVVPQAVDYWISKQDAHRNGTSEEGRGIS